MRRILIPLACLLAVCLVTQAHASAVSYLIGDGQTVNILEDNDWETAIDIDKDGSLSEGDYLLGMWEVQQVNYDPANPPPAISGSAFTAIFFVKVASTGAGVEFDHSIVFEGASEDDWDTFLGIDVHADGVAGIMYSDSTQDFGSQFVNQFDGGGVPGSLATAMGTELWEFGFTGDNVFWKSEADSLDLALVSQLKYAAGLNVIFTYPGAPLLLPHEYLTESEGIAFLGETDVQLAGGQGTHLAGNFELATDTDIFIVPTPEPGTLALLGLGLAACGGVLYRRRRKA